MSYNYAKVLSIYEPKKAIGRTVLNPAFDKGVSIGERRVAAVVYVTDLDGNHIDMNLEFARKNRLAAAFAGGATFMSKELAQTIGAVRLISQIFFRRRKLTRSYFIVSHLIVFYYLLIFVKIQ